MNDLISREAVLALQKDLEFKRVKGLEHYRYRCIDPDAVRDLPSVQPEQRWIPCSERLPEVPCLVSDANNNFPYAPAGIITLEDKEHGKWAIDGKWLERMMLDGEEADMLIYSNRIVAWMPLPEPYKEGDTT